MDIKQMTVPEIQHLLKESAATLTDEMLKNLRDDPRTGVRRLYQQIRRQKALEDQERRRLDNLRLYEKEARRNGFSMIAGVDEAGRGPLAGPVVAAAVILPEQADIYGIDDSKKLSPDKREELYTEIKERALFWSVGISGVEEIDSLNILRASLMAMQRAVLGLAARPEYILVDAVKIPGLDIPQLPIVKGDGKSISIAAASIIAKVTRDRLMEDYDRQFPDYGFIRHKGYGTADHLEAIRKYGRCPLHRKSFTKKFTPAGNADSLW